MMSANLRAFLFVIRWCEGTSDEEGYRRMVGGTLFDRLDDHPRQTHSGVFSNGTAWRSTAAGAYQFLARTWDEARAALGLPDFSQKSQDEAAVWLIKRAKALEDVEAGRLREALVKCSPTWASLPYAPYGQPVKTYEACERIYRAAGGTLSQQAGATPPVVSPTPPPAPAPAAPYFPSTESDPGLPEQTMPLPVAAAVALGAELLKLLPMFSSGSKSAERNVAAGQAVGGKLLEIAKEVAGPAMNEQAAVEAVQKNPQLRDQFVAKAVASWSDLAPMWEAEEKSRREAREFGVHLVSEGPAWRQIGAGVLIGCLSLTIILGGGAMFWSLMSSPQLDPGQKGLILGALLSVFSSTAAYWFGSSATSRIKDQTIAEQARR